jgi:beta-lactamase class A SHV
VNQQNAGLFLFVTPLLTFIGPHSRMYCGYALCSPVYYLLLATLPLAVHASPQPLEQIKLSESQLSGRVGMIEMDLASGRTLTAWRADERFP